MNDTEGFAIHELGRRARPVDQPQLRAVGSPLPVGNGGRPSSSASDEEVQAPRNPPPGRALTNPAPQQGSGLDRAMSLVRMALPFVQRLLPLLDGNIVTAVSNVLTSHPAPPQPQQHPPVDLEPIENHLSDLRNQHRELRVQLGEQNTSLKRVEDQLEMVREATDRNTLEQQELLEDLKAVGNKVNVFAMFALGLLGISILINVILYLHIRRVLP
jgi:hypothetical protein